MDEALVIEAVGGNQLEVGLNIVSTALGTMNEVT